MPPPQMETGDSHMQITLLSMIGLLGFALVASMARASPQTKPDGQAASVSGEIATKLAVLLDASGDQGQLMERTDGLRKVKPEEFEQVFPQSERFSYPSRSPAALDARRDLLSRGAAVVPLAIAELKKCDVATWPGWSRAMYSNALLQEMSLGQVGCGFAIDAKSKARNEQMVAAWSELAARTKESPDFWSGRRGVDAKRVAAFTDKLPAAFIAAEMVMTPGMKIRATTSVGAMTIGTDNGFRRSYEWDGAVRWAQLDPRAERWNGSLGAYFPGPGDHWEPHKGITRGVVEEGQMHFATVGEAMDWIEAQKQQSPLAYRNDGLLVAWDKTPERNQLNVDVWQITIDGKAPTELVGSSDDAVVVTK
jgi:hypothetical protein